MQVWTIKNNQEKKYSLQENHEQVKVFLKDDVNKIRAGTLDYTKLFLNERSAEKLLKALNEREKTLGFTEPSDFKKKINEVRKIMGIEDLRPPPPSKCII